MNIMQMENGIMNITQKDRELLFKDLSSRLPYHVRVKIWLKDGTTEEGVLDLEHNYADVLLDAFYYNKIKDIKPYLRPMSSMTEEEKEDYKDLLYCVKYGVDTATYITLFAVNMLTDWFNAHHFDYRGLIKKGLAIAVNEENNPYK